MAEWTTEFPTEVGDYWFYGYRYGKVSCGHKSKPDIMRLKVRKCANGVMYEAQGQFMYEKEVEEAHFCPIEFPELPEINTELTPEQEAKLIR